MMGYRTGTSLSAAKWPIAVFRHVYQYNICEY
jgi:hypothetical protein